MHSFNYLVCYHFVVADPEEPVISVPDAIIANEVTAINCSGKIGRDNEGNSIAPIYLEVLFEVITLLV